MLLLEQVLVLRTQVHDRLHVDLVEGGQHGHGGLRLDQALGDLGPQAGHRHALLDTVAGGEDRRLGSRGGRLGRGGRGVLLRFDRSDHVLLGHATALAGAGDAVRIDAGFLGQLARGRGQDGVVAASGGRSGGLCSRSGGGRSGSRSGRSGGTAFVQLAEQLVAQNGVAFVLDDLGQHAVSLGENLDDHLVGLDVDDQFVALDCFARLLVPGGDGAVGDRFREGWGFDFDSHCVRFLKFGFFSA